MSSNCSGWTNPSSGSPARAALPASNPLHYYLDPEQQLWRTDTTPSRWRISCLLLSSFLAIHTMWQIKRNANSWPIPNCLASLPAWVLGNLCATVQHRAVDLKQTAWYFSRKQIYSGSIENCHSGFATNFILFLVEIHCPSTMSIMLIWYHGRCQRPEGYNFLMTWVSDSLWPH